MLNELPIVLFCCNRLAPTRELAYVVRATMMSGQVRPLVLLGSKSLMSHLPPDIFGGADVLIFPKVLRPIPKIDLPRVLGLSARIFRLLRLHFLADACLLKRNHLQGERVLAKLLETHQIRIVAISDDRTLGWDFGVTCAANSRGLGTVAIPFALSDPEADWLSREKRASFDVNRGSFFERALKKRLSKTFHENLRSKEGRTLLFLSVGQAWMVKHLKVCFPRPWAYGGGITRSAAVFGDADRTKQIALGVNSDKIFVTGQSSMDQLFESREMRAEIRTKLRLELELGVSDKFIICAVPQYMEHGMIGAKEHWRLTEQMLASLASTGANVVLSLHPRSRYEDYRRLAARYGASISKRPLVEILAAADLFVATHSSTVRWAILLRIPVVILDDFAIGDNPLYKSAGVQFLTERVQLERLTRSLLEDSRKRTSIIAKMESVAAMLDPFDGQNSARILDLFRAMLPESVNC